MVTGADASDPSAVRVSLEYHPWDWPAPHVVMVRDEGGTYAYGFPFKSYRDAQEMMPIITQTWKTMGNA